MLAVMLLVGWLVILGISVARAPARERTMTESEVLRDGADTSARERTGIQTGRVSDSDNLSSLPERSPVTGAQTGAGRTARKAGIGAGFHPATRPTTYRGHTASFWAGQFRHRTRQLQNARRVLHTDPHVVEAINLACATYGHCSTLWRKAGCETGGTYSARSLNSSSSASGLFQFLPSTWRTTPYGRFSIWSPYANALAAGWMHVQGRGNEWECR